MSLKSNPFDQEIKIIEQELENRRLSNNFYDYVQHANPEYTPTRLHEYLCNSIQKFIEKQSPAHSFDVLLLSVPPQHGKGYPVSTPVLTVKGWKKHGDLKRGDYVYNHLGEPVMVTHNQKPYMHPCMEVKFHTGEKHIVTREHLWLVELDRHKLPREPKILETQDIFKTKHRRKPAIRAALPLINSSKELLIEPYVLGLWLGDGSSARNALTLQEKDRDDVFANIKNTPVGIHNDSIILGTEIKPNKWDFTQHLRELDLYKNKHIPVEYLLASEEQRFELFRGMMDTDGYVDTRGRCEYTSINKRLADDFFTLARSLGFKATIITGDATINGRYISKKYRVTFSPNKGQHIFNIKRKQDRVTNKTTGDRIDKFRYFIESIEPVEDHLVSCITVEGGMYLAGEGLIPTHNSVTITETLPSWYLGKNPSHDAIIVSYNEDTAQRFGRRNREKLEQFAGTIFPKYTPKTSPWSNTEFESTNKGRCLSRGVFSGVTGNPAHLFIIDDPIKNRQEADSPTTRAAILNEYLNTFRTRIKPQGKLIVIQTRWHEEDLFGTLADTVSPHRLTIINLPCEAEENDPLGREPGEALLPEIGRGNAWLEEFKQEYTSKEGRRAWAALYQGHPSTEGGNIIKTENFQFYDVPPTEINYKLISVDAAFKAGQDNDYVVAQVWGKIDNNYYLLDQTRDKLTFVETLNAIRELRVSHPDTQLVLIEDKANGSAIINVLSDEMEGIIPVEPSGGKVSRAHAVTPAIEDSRVFIPRYASWTGEFLAECSAFPNTRHDDQVDSMTQALHHMIYVESNTATSLNIKYREWRDDMWEDFNNADEFLQNELLKLWGHPEEWREINE